MKFILAALILPSAIFLNSCAKLMSDSSYPVIVKSNPTGLKYTVTNKGGKLVSQGATPATVTLKSGAGYFKKESYKIEVFQKGKLAGQTQLTATIDGWYFGNILLGGVIGLLIVDPISGAMYSLPEEVTVGAAAPLASVSGKRLNIALLSSLSKEDRAKLIPLKK